MVDRGFEIITDPSEYKNYILTMLFLSDVWNDKQREYLEKYKGDKERIKRALARERFVVPEECDFDYLYTHRDAPNIGELINMALEKIEDTNKAKLENVFRNIDFNSEPALGQTKERNRRLKHLLEDFNDARLELRPSRIGHRDVIGDVYEYLIGQFAAGARKKAGEFYTPLKFRHCLPSLSSPSRGIASAIQLVALAPFSSAWPRRSMMKMGSRARISRSLARSPTAARGPCAA